MFIGFSTRNFSNYGFLNGILEKWMKSYHAKGELFEVKSGSLVYFLI